ncbi:hypothetical protein LCGC14_0817290 [marine sediment metagenome]|uniref:Uncharacterized protein n=1 Tax=marine sediment metagenome TaxID=412755 RepID=A0A0F9SSD3_9ZZZZ
MWDWTLFLLAFASGIWLGHAVARVADWLREWK